MSLSQVVWPLLLGLPGWLGFAHAVRGGRRRDAVAWVVLWTALLMVGLPAVESRRPGTLPRLAPGAERYGTAMLEWAATGNGCESEPRCFLPQHALHAGVFAVAAAASGGLLALAFASVLFVWMGTYAAGLAAASGRSIAVLLAWHPWALLRVAAFIALGLALSEPLLRRGLPPLPGRGRWLAAGCAGLLADALLKALLAPWWWAHVIHPLVAR